MSEGAAVRVIIADDHAMVREGIKSVLERAGFEVVGEASTGTVISMATPCSREPPNRTTPPSALMRSRIPARPM